MCMRRRSHEFLEEVIVTNCVRYSNTNSCNNPWEGRSKFHGKCSAHTQPSPRVCHMRSYWSHLRFGVVPQCRASPHPAGPSAQAAVQGRSSQHVSAGRPSVANSAVLHTTLITAHQGA